MTNQADATPEGTPEGTPNAEGQAPAPAGDAAPKYQIGPEGDIVLDA